MAWNGSQAVFLWSGQSAADTLGVSFRLATILSGTNTQPSITSNGGQDVASVSISENTTAVTTVTATDADVPAQTLTFTKVGGADQAKFPLTQALGSWRFWSPLILKTRSTAMVTTCMKSRSKCQMAVWSPRRRSR